MRDILVDLTTGDRIDITNASNEEIDALVAGNEDNFSVEQSSKEIAQQEAQTMPQRIAEAQQAVMAEEQSNESPLMTFAKNAVRTVVPYSSEEIERTGNVTSAGSTRDLATAPLRLNPFSKLGTFGLGLARTLIDVGAQSQYGNIEPERTAITAGVNALPLVGGINAKYSPLSKFGELTKKRASRQAYGSIGAKEKFTRTNPITPEKVEEVFLKENKIPILATERGALEKMQEYNEAEIARKGGTRSDIAQGVEKPVNVLSYDFNDNGEVMLGALNDAKTKIMADIQSGAVTPETGKKMLAELNRQDRIIADTYSKGNITAEKATKLVTALRKDSKMNVTTRGEGTPKSEALREYVDAINARIEQASPELRQATRAMAPNMAIAKPLEERIVKATVNKPYSGVINLPVISDVANAWETLNRRPQGAMLKYNLGRMMIEGSPMLRSAYETGRYNLPNE